MDPSLDREVKLEDMLLARDRRRDLQLSLLAQYGKPLICFTMNIPGPRKNSSLIRSAYFWGKRMLEEALREQGMEVICRKEIREHTGNEAFYVIDAPARSIKELAVSIEESGELGRLFDMDVLDGPDHKIGRSETGFPERRCLLCGERAALCASRRAHSLTQLQQRIRSILEKETSSIHQRTISRLAVKSLLYEVCTTPKPGLVDREDNGSHKDMDMFTFMSSSAALGPYFEDCARLGMKMSGQSAEELFNRLRKAGLEAERVMRGATDGVNTHKGAIFSLGILCGALGRLPEESWSDPGLVLGECAAIARGVCERDFRGLDRKSAVTTGQRLFVSSGIRGVRGQAEDGFPAVLNAGLPVLQHALSEGFSLDWAGCAALLALIAAATDTNMIARGGEAMQQMLSHHAGQMIAEDPVPSAETMRSLNRLYKENNISPGGSADLLAMTYFLYFLTQEIQVPYLPVNTN